MNLGRPIGTAAVVPSEMNLGRHPNSANLSSLLLPFLLRCCPLLLPFLRRAYRGSLGYVAGMLPS
jgi:hypothetical protein